MKYSAKVKGFSIVVPDFMVEVEDNQVSVPTIPPVTQPAPTNRIFSASSIYNKPLLDNAPIHANSAAMVTELVRQATKTPGLWGDASINSWEWSTPFYIVTDPSTPKRKVTLKQNGVIRDEFTEFNARINAGIRIPAGAKPDPQLDGHIAILDTIDNVYYDFWQFKEVNGELTAVFGGLIDNASNSDGIIMPMKNKWGGMSEMGAAATSLPIAGGLIRASELKAGVIPHALRFSVVKGGAGFVWPARRSDGSMADSPSTLKAGQRLRYPAGSQPDPTVTPIEKMMYIAGRDYGMILEDTSGAVSFYAENTNVTTGQNCIEPYMGGKQMWEIMQRFPFNKLQALA